MTDAPISSNQEVSYWRDQAIKWEAEAKADLTVIERLRGELRLAESARDYANDMLDRARQRSAVETTADVRQLFNGGIGVQLGNKFSFSFETEEEADRAFHYIADLGTLETSPPVKPSRDARGFPLSASGHAIEAVCAACHLPLITTDEESFTHDCECMYRGVPQTTKPLPSFRQMRGIFNQNQAGSAPSDAAVSVPTPRGSLPNSLGASSSPEEPEARKCPKCGAIDSEECPCSPDEQWSAEKASGECCLDDPGGGFVCTLPKGHAGQHEAYGTHTNLLQSWSAENGDGK